MANISRVLNVALLSSPLPYSSYLALTRELPPIHFSDLILLCTHSPQIYTVGKNLSSSDLPNHFHDSSSFVPITPFDEHDPVIGHHGDDFVEVYRTTRGGQVTWHGPGQLMIYPFVNVREMGGGVGLRGFVCGLLRMCQEALFRSHGLEVAVQSESSDLLGLWSSTSTSEDDSERAAKVGSLGLNVSRGIVTHGVGINVSCDVEEAFSQIVPCGLGPDVPITSVSQIVALSEEERHAPFAFDDAVQKVADAVVDVLSDSGFVSCDEMCRDVFGYDEVVILQEGVDFDFDVDLDGSEKDVVRMLVDLVAE